jgi:hypothetical protein
MQFERRKPSEIPNAPHRAARRQTRGGARQDRDLNPGGQSHLAEFKVIPRPTLVDVVDYCSPSCAATCDCPFLASHFACLMSLVISRLSHAMDVGSVMTHNCSSSITVACHACAYMVQIAIPCVATGQQQRPLK